MLLCVTTYCFIGFNSCQKDALPLTNQDIIKNESQDPLLREDGIFADIENDYPQEECDCCVTIEEFSITWDTPTQTNLVFTMTNGNSCQMPGGNTGCPGVGLTLGDLETLGIEGGDDCYETMDLTGNICHEFNCDLSSFSDLDFYAAAVPTAEGAMVTGGFISITIECTAAPSGTLCGDADVGGTSTPPPTYTILQVTQYHSLGTVVVG